MKNSKIYPWIVVALLWGVALLNYMDRQMLSTMKDAMQVDIVELQSATNFGRLMAVFLWIYGLMSPISGMIADRLNRKWLIVGSLFVWSFPRLYYFSSLCARFFWRFSIISPLFFSFSGYIANGIRQHRYMIPKIRLTVTLIPLSAAAVCCALAI